jgi:predicted nuclease of predicted toxin-antitoxin system
VIVKFMVDEHINTGLIKRLADAGYDVQRAAIERRGMTDGELLAACLDGERVLITEDWGFGSLIYAGGAKSHGVAIVALARFDGSPDERSATVAEIILGQARSLVGHLTIIEPHRTRQKSLN